ncbi:hypothetical protein [Salinicola aestuarinus]|uniref:hypothetical protein n=1 Tax=Salinicola aestuarinus TaxID=1949082 RepID=UPI00130081F6|nr:hypothetical protein [Salinicola aestuarinus]
MKLKNKWLEETLNEEIEKVKFGVKFGAILLVVNAVISIASGDPSWIYSALALSLAYTIAECLNFGAHIVVRIIKIKKGLIND